MDSMDQALLAHLREAAERAFRATPVLFAYLFGSQVTGRTHAWSDVDAAVYLESTDGEHPSLDLTLDLIGRFEMAARLGNVDLVVLNAAPLRLVGRIIQQRMVLYSRDEPARVRFESLKLREFFDFEIHAQELDRKFLEDFAQGRR
jgi:predicted nucleotidyltransferase